MSEPYLDASRAYLAPLCWERARWKEEHHGHGDEPDESQDRQTTALAGGEAASLGPSTGRSARSAGPAAPFFRTNCSTGEEHREDVGLVGRSRADRSDGVLECARLAFGRLTRLRHRERRSQGLT